MTIIDRYILRLFVKVLVICFISLTGLYVVVDAFGNLDEFISHGEMSEGGVVAVLVEYYVPRVADFFDRTSPLLALIAAMFAVTWLQRTNELTALLAAGVNLRRIVTPLILGAVTVSVLAVANREIIIPNHRNKLVRNAQNWQGTQSRPVRPQFDYRSDILLGGRHIVESEQKIIAPSFRISSRRGTFGRMVSAATAVYQPAQEERPGGFLMSGVTVPDDLADHASVYDGDDPVILSPRDTAWLAVDELFVVSGVSFEQLANGAALRRYSSSRELFAGLHNPSLDLGTDVRVTIHSRLVQPFLDLTLLFLGLPLALSRDNRNVFIAAGMSMLVVGIFLVVTMACHALGGSGLVQPAFAAWCPLLLFVPVALAIAQPLCDR